MKRQLKTNPKNQINVVNLTRHADHRPSSSVHRRPPKKTCTRPVAQPGAALERGEK